jgi:hypothetical protein
MPSIFQLENFELVALTEQKQELLTKLDFADKAQIGIEAELTKLRKDIKKTLQSPVQEVTVEAQPVATLEELQKSENNLLFLQKIEAAIKKVEEANAKQTKAEDNGFFNILDDKDDQIQSVSYHFPGVEPKIYTRGELTDGVKNFSDNQVLRIQNPRAADVTVRFNNGGTFTKHADGNISISIKMPKADAMGQSIIHKTDFETKQLFSFTDQILFDYKSQKTSGQSSKIPINLDFESVPGSLKDEWKQRTLKNIIYTYTLEGESHGRQDRFNDIISALIAGGSMTSDDMNRYSIKLNQASSYDLQGFNAYQKVTNAHRFEEVSKKFENLPADKKSTVDSEGWRTASKVGKGAAHFTISALKGLVNTGLDLIGSPLQIPEAAGMFGKKELDEDMLDNLKALNRDVKDKQVGEWTQVKEAWGKIPAYKRLKESGLTDEQIFDAVSPPTPQTPTSGR